MSDPYDKKTASEQKVYSVTEISQQLERMFSGDHIFGSSVKVCGELAGVSCAVAKSKRNGKEVTYTNLYFDIKDESGKLNCYKYLGEGVVTEKSCFGEWFKNGTKVIATGKIEVTKFRGKEYQSRYSFKPVKIEPAGEGEILRSLKELDARLEREGYYAKEHKMAIPHYPQTIGIVTSPTGGAIVDIVQHIRDREPSQRMILYPAQVQGEAAPGSIEYAIQVLESYGVDVICLGRGGGSADDLAAFGDEKVAKAIYNCTVPIVTFVGHTADVSIADKVADKAGGTPTDAATILIPLTVEERLDKITHERKRAVLAMENAILKRRDRLQKQETKLAGFAPAERLQNMKAAMKHAGEMLVDRMEKRLMEAKGLCERRSTELPIGLKQHLTRARYRYDRAYDALVVRFPIERSLERAKQRFERAGEALISRSLMDRHLERARHRYESACDKLGDRNPLKKLRGGFGYVKNADGKAVSSFDQVKQGDRIAVQMEKGKIISCVEETLAENERK